MRIIGHVMLAAGLLALSAGGALAQDVGMKKWVKGKGWGWVCQRALPVKWSAGELDATTNQVAIETLELAHHGLRREI